MKAASAKLKETAGKLGAGEKTAEGYTAKQLGSMASSLDEATKALDSNGSESTGSYFANAISNKEAGALGWKPTTNGTGDVGGTKINIRETAISSKFVIGHESLHNAGLEHPKNYKGVMAYKYGNLDENLRWQTLPIDTRHGNPDWVMSEVYP